MDGEASPCRVLSAAIAAGIEDKPGFFMGLRGVVVFDVRGDRGLTIRLGATEAPIGWGDADDAGLRVSMDREALASMLDGTLDLRAQLASGRLALEGEVDLLRPIVQLLQAGRSALAVRSAE